MSHYQLTPFDVGQVKAHLEHGLSAASIADRMFKQDGKTKFGPAAIQNTRKPPTRNSSVVMMYGPISSKPGAASCAIAKVGSSVSAAPTERYLFIFIGLSLGFARSKRVIIGLAGPHAKRAFHVENEDLAVADLVGPGG